MRKVVQKIKDLVTEKDYQDILDQFSIDQIAEYVEYLDVMGKDEGDLEEMKLMFE
jgi:hypothetical protein